jgi:hypothetical protein
MTRRKKPLDALGRWINDAKAVKAGQTPSGRHSFTSLTAEQIADSLRHEQSDFDPSRCDERLDPGSGQASTRRVQKSRRKTLSQPPVFTLSASVSVHEEEKVLLYHPREKLAVWVKRSLVPDFLSQGYQHEALSAGDA